MSVLTWLGIAFCVSQSAIFSGLNLAMFGFSRLRLEIEAESGTPAAEMLLRLRRDSNFLLTTILWGNVGINVLLTLLSNSVMAGAAAFMFSTFVITLLGEIAPQAYFSRHALRMAALLTPVIRFYQVLLYPVARPTAWVLDRWLGREGIHYFREEQLRDVIRKHMLAPGVDIDRIEGLGALNFLALDDLEVAAAGTPVDDASIVALPAPDGVPVFPPFARVAEDPFLQRVQRSGRKWVIVTDEQATPLLVLDADEFLRDALFGPDAADVLAHCHRPIVVRDTTTRLGHVLGRWRASPALHGEETIEQDLILVWNDTRRVITGADILGRLLQGIAVR